MLVARKKLIQELCQERVNCIPDVAGMFEYDAITTHDNLPFLPCVVTDDSIFVHSDHIANQTRWFEMGEQLHMQIEDAKKFIHDVTFKYICHECDMRVDRVITGYHGKYGLKTPDWIFEMDGIWHIVEFATKRLPVVLSLHSYAKAKIEKYTGLITDLIDKKFKVKFDVIVVSTKKVLSSVPLHSSMIEALCARYSMASTAFNNIKANYPQLRRYLKELEVISSNALKLEPCMQELNDRKDDILESFEKIVEELPDASFNINTMIDHIEDEVMSSFNQEIEMYDIHDLVEPGGRYDPTDTVSRLPLIIPEFESTLKPIVVSDCDLSLGMKYIWTHALESYAILPERHYVDNFPKDPSKIEEHIRKMASITTKKERNTRFRFKVPRHAEAQLELALRGVEGKSYKKHPSIIERKKYTQQHISVETETDDIEDFIQSFPDIAYNTEVSSQFQSLDLLEMSLGNNKSDVKSVYSNLHDRVYESLVFISEVAVEISASLQQKCKHREYLLKRMRNRDVFLVLKPTTSNQHIFFSMAVRIRTDLYPNGFVFPTGINVDGWTFYDFRSLQVPILDTLIKLPEMYLSMKYLCFDDMSKAMMHELAVGLLVALDNKADAEEVVTKTRYIYMIGLEMPYKIRNPWRALKGLPERPRSRLTLCLMKKSVKLCDKVLNMCANVSTAEDTDILNIPAYASDLNLKDWNHALCVFYMGYFRNKNAYTSGNQSIAMIEKIVKPEIKFNEDEVYREHTRKGSAEKPTGMEWNLGYLLFCIDQFKEYLISTGMKDVNKQLTDLFLEDLSRFTILDLATLKASNVDDRTGEYSPGEKYIPREKLLIVLKDSIKVFGVSMSDCLISAVQIIYEKNGEMPISLFKKAQHGGLREIYVMTIACRILQFCIERLGRIICELIPTETMTHLKMKTDYRMHHFAKVKENKLYRRVDCKTSTVYDNADMEKWNQNHHVQKFYVMCRKLTDERIEGFLKIIFSMWLNKRIQLDVVLLKSMYNGIYHPSSETAKHVVDAFRGIKDSPIMPKQHRALHIETGMMQGLLHFISSAFHAIASFGAKEVCKILIKRQKVRLQIRLEKNVFIRSEHTMIVSSDDSVVCHTILSNLDSGIALAYGALPCSIAYRVCSQYLGIVTSMKKSTFCTAPISEFNSMWSGPKGVFRPATRHILACFSTASLGSLLEQQDQLASLRQSCLESGVSIHHTSFINLLQGLVYYRCLGESVSGAFSYYKKLLKKLPDPNLGFFLLDPQKLSGIVTTDFNVYVWAKNNPLVASKYNKYTNTVDPLLGTRGSLRSSLQAQVTFTGTEKFRALIKEMDRIGLKEIIKDDPSILYKRPVTQKDIEIHICLKLLTVEVQRSLCKDFNVQARSMAASVYMLWAPIIRNNISFIHLISDMPECITKTSIINLLHEEINYLEPEVLGKKAIEWFFPLHEQYERVESIGKEADSRIEMYQKSEPKAPVAIEIMHGIKFDIPVEQVARWQWFDLRPENLDEYVLATYWAEFVTIFTFLRDTHNETMEAAGFEDPRALKSALEKTSKKSRFLHVTSRGGRNIHSAGLLSYISYNYKEDHVLKVAEYVDREDDPVRKSLRRIAMVLETPMPEDYKMHTIQDEIDRVPLSVWESHTRYSPFALVHKDQKKDLSSFEVTKLVRSYESLVGCFTTSQDRTGKRWKGYGVWEGICCSRDKFSLVRVTLKDHIIELIQITDYEVVKQCTSQFIKMFNEWNVKPDRVHQDNALTHFSGVFGSQTGSPVRIVPHHLYTSSMLTGFKIVVEDKDLTIWSTLTPLYTFKPLPQMIIKGEPTTKKLIDYVLDNAPLPYPVVADFLLTNFPTGSNNWKMQEWFKKLSKVQRRVYVPESLCLEDFEQFEFGDLRFDFMSTIDTTVPSLMGGLCVQPMEFTEDYLTDVLNFNEDFESAEPFTFTISGQSKITSAHFCFLESFMTQLSVLTLQRARGKDIVDKRDRQILNLIAGLQFDEDEMQWTTGISEEYDPYEDPCVRSTPRKKIKPTSDSE